MRRFTRTSSRWVRVATALVLACMTVLVPLSIALAESKRSTVPIGSGPSASPLAPLYAHSFEASDIVTLFVIILIESGVVFALVVAALFFNIVRFSHKPGHDEEPKQVYGNRRIEVAWTLIPALILAVAFVITVIVMVAINNPERAVASQKLGLKPNTPVIVQAIGHQWWWEFKFPQYHFVTANEFHIPLHTTVEVETTSVDVIHSFWIPQLDRQIDATPNNRTIVYINADNTGTFPGACYEYCGQGHAWMQFRVAVDKPTTFMKWVHHERSPAAFPAGRSALKGQSLFFGLSCTACHTITGTPGGAAAPNLTHLGSRWGIAGGVLPMSKVNLARWVANPGQYKEGALMPAFHLGKRQLNDLASYLISLK